MVGALLADTRPLRVPAFRRLWISSAVTAFGSQFTAVAVPKQVFDLTHSSGYVGLTGAAALVPLMVFGLWGGAIADALDRRTVMLVTNAGVAVTSTLLWLQAWLRIDSVLLVLVLLALNQAFFAVNMPTRSAVVARLVPAELVPSAVVLNSTMSQFAMVFGPLAAGALLPLAGLPTLYLLDAIVLILTLWLVSHLPALPPLNGPSRRAGVRDVLNGLRYLVTRKILLASFLLDLIAMVAGMPRALYPQMAEDTFNAPAGGGVALGWLYAAMPIGGLLCGLASGWLSRVRRHGVGVALAVVAWGVTMVGFGLAGPLWLAVVCLALGGAADFVSMVFRSAMLQMAATDEMRGRLQGVFTVVVAGGPRLADITHGWTAAGVGTAAAASGGGGLVVVLTVFAVLMLPAFWRYRASVDGATESAGDSTPSAQPARVSERGTADPSD